MKLSSAQLQTQFQALKDNRLFEFFVIFIIIISALEIGAKTYALSESALKFTQFLDIFITLFFLVEIIIRFVGESNKRAFFKSGWNVFDTVVVVISLIPIDDSEMVLLFPF